MRLTYQNLNPCKLMDELMAQGITPLAVLSEPSDTYVSSQVYLEMPEDTPEETLVKIEAIVATHNPTPKEPEPTKEELLNRRIQELETQVLALTPTHTLDVAVDKLQIKADGVDFATITMQVQPNDVVMLDVLGDGEAVAEIPVVDGIATFEFDAIDTGKYAIEIICGDLYKHVFITATEVV